MVDGWLLKAAINLPDLLGIVFTNIVNQYNGDGPNHVHTFCG
jgi:hypothetical protein